MIIKSLITLSGSERVRTAVSSAYYPGSNLSSLTYKRDGKMIDQKKLDKVTRALLGMESVEHKRPPKPSSKDLKRKFKMKLNRSNGKPSIKEV